MNEKNTISLVKSAPLLIRYYAQREADRPPLQPPYKIAEGFQCGDGWFDLLMRLSVKLEAELPNRLALGFTETKLPFVREVSSCDGRLYFTLRFFMSDAMDLDWIPWIQAAIEESTKTEENP